MPWNFVFLEDFLGPTKALTLQPRCMTDGILLVVVLLLSWSSLADCVVVVSADCGLRFVVAIRGLRLVSADCGAADLRSCGVADVGALGFADCRFHARLEGTSAR